MSFARPWFLLALALVPWLVSLHLRRRRQSAAAVRFSDLTAVRSAMRGHGGSWRWVVPALRVLALLLLVAAAAGPRLHRTFEELVTHGVDIMLVVDCSGSMQAEDFKPVNRLHVAKEVVRDFITGRKHDRIGLVVFAGVAFTQCPLTLDYGVLESFVDRLAIGTVERDGTAIGPALAAGLNRLRDSDAQSKVIVLLTDGAENVPNLKVTYQQAAQLAQAVGVKIYAVGVGKDDEVPMPVNDPIFGKRYVWYRAELNEEGLREIATLTGGRYFRATDADALKEIFGTIDKLEKSEIKVKHYTRYEELYAWLVWPALLVVLVEVVLAGTRFRTLP